MQVKSESEVAQSCLTVSDPMDCSLPGSSVHGISQARVLEWGAIADDYIFPMKFLVPILSPALVSLVNALILLTSQFFFLPFKGISSFLETSFRETSVHLEKSGLIIFLGSSYSYLSGISLLCSSD